MFTSLDRQWTQGEWHNFKDEGKLSAVAATRRFSVWDRRSGTLIGNIKWFTPWRQYVFFPMDYPLTPKMAREIFKFCEMTTYNHKNK